MGKEGRAQCWKGRVYKPTSHPNEPALSVASYLRVTEISEVGYLSPGSSQSPGEMGKGHWVKLLQVPGL